MATKSNSEFIQKVNGFIESVENVVNEDSNRAIIVIASEENEDGKTSTQSGTIRGTQTEILAALVGFISKPMGKQYLMMALEYIKAVNVNVKDVEEEQEGEE